MQAKFIQVINAIPSINILAELNLPVKAAYAVSKLATACAHAQREYEEQRNNVFEKAGCKVDEKSNKWVHDDAAVLESCMKQANELLDADTTLNALPLDLEQFGSAPIPAKSFVNLDWAMKGDTSPPMA